MKIYKVEKKDGLAEKIRTSSSIAYVSQLEPLDPTTAFAKKLVRTVASDARPSDTLYPLKDILVTTGCNLNTDVFDNAETWIAKHTPLHHPLNFLHDEKRIIGTITASQAVDIDLTPLSDGLAVDELPEKFHILNGSVIYRTWQDEEQQKLIDQTIAEIENHEWFMSMECLFGGFDYAVWGPDGSSRVVARNEESAFLTKHLRQYGGTGSYKCPSTGSEFKLGRVLRGIRFIGKGLVKTPANPESVILNHVSAFVSASADLGYITREAEVTSIPESNHMPDIKQLEDRVAELTKVNETLKERDGHAAKAEIEGLKADVANRDKKIEVLEAKVSELTTSVNSLTQKVNDTEAAKVAVDTELSALKAEQVQRARLALLTGKGAPAEKAADLVKKFAKFSEEEFNEIVDTLSAAWKTPVATKQAEDVIDEAVKTKVNDPVLAATEPSDEDKSQQRIAKASKLMANFLHYSGE